MGRNDLIAKMLNERNALKGRTSDMPRALTDKGIIDEVTNLVFAGTDSTGNTLSYLFYELSNHPQWQARLREELKDVPQSQKYSAIAELPILEAVVQEILRLRPAAPASLQRITPETGGVIDDVVVPPGVSLCSRLKSLIQYQSLQVGCLRYRAHRLIRAIDYCLVPGINDSKKSAHLSRSRHI